MIHFHNQYGVAYCGAKALDGDWESFQGIMDCVDCPKCIKLAPPIRAAIARGTFKDGGKRG